MSMQIPARDKDILVADDHPAVIRFITAVLTSEGYDVIPCADGLEALHQLSLKQYDLLVLDIKMPGMDGVELCKAIRKLDAYRHTPILIFTSRNDEETIDEVQEAGADAYLAKPVPIKHLVQTVETLLAG